MANELRGLRVAILATDGVEQVELQKPWEAMEREGAEVELISIHDGQLQAFNHLDKGDRFEIDQKVGKVDPEDYDALFIPGGVANPDALRMNPDAVRFARAFFQAGKPVASICHGPWLLVEANVVGGRTLTSWPSLQTDIRNAGGQWVDEEVFVDGQLVTSRKPADIPAFIDAVVELFGRPLHPAREARGLRRGSRPADSVEEMSRESFPASDPPPGP